MSYEILPTPEFERRLKTSRKWHRSLFDDVLALSKELAESLYSGESLGRNCYKVRLAISSKGKGKSGGARVITYVLVQDEQVLLLTIYDKTDKENLAPGELDALLAELEF